MKFIISRQELSELVGRIQNIVAPKTPIPILSNFLLEAQDERLVLTATDLTVAVRISGPAKVILPGASTVPARRFTSLIKELTASHIEVSSNDRDMIQIVADASTFRLNGMPKSEFPSLPDFSDATRITFKQKDLKDMLFRTAFAVSKADDRYVLTGVYMQIVQGEAFFVGTDGKRLARAQLPIQVSGEMNAECIIPLKAVDEITKNLQNDDEEAVLYVMPDKIAVEASSCMIMTKLLSGEYPNVEKVIPQQTNQVVSIHRDELMSLLRQVSLFTTDPTHSVRFSFDKGELYLSINTMNVGEGKVCMPVNYHGPRFDIAFNPAFFLDILRHSKEETVSLGFSDAYNPGIIVDGEHAAISNKPYPSPLFVLMPMRLTEEHAEVQK